MVVIAAALVVTWRVSPEVATVDSPAATPIPATPPATAVPAGFVEAWRAPSGATVVPAVAGPAVVTADGDTVDGRDPASGVVTWSYRRDRPLCTVKPGFPDAAGGPLVLALYRNGGGDWCSELTALHPAAGTRDAASNPDVRPGTQLVAAGSYVVATGERYLEVWRSDLVRTLQYGDQPTPAQPGRQPRPDCTHGAVALSGDRVGVIERCPGAAADRVTVLAAAPSAGADQPQVLSTTQLSGPDAVLVALSADRTAVAVGGRLVLLDAAGGQVGAQPLSVPVTATGQPAVTSDGYRDYWWTGSGVVTLDARTLAPLWTQANTLGPPVPYGSSLLVPVAGGLRVLDPATGRVLRTVPVDRGAATPVRLAVAGSTLLEQRGTEVVALRPS